MAAPQTGAITLSSTGIKTFIIGVQPTYIRFNVSQNGSTQAFTHLSVGFTDGVAQACHSIAQDTVDGKTVRSSSKVISLWSKVSGSWVEILSASWNAWTATGFKLNVTAADASYSVDIEAWS